METIIMYGKPVAENIKTQVKEWIERDLDDTPELLIITIGNDDASKVYVKNKLKAAAEVGINATNLRFTDEDYFNGDMKYMNNLKKALGPLFDYLEESMAQYVESQDRIRHITTLDWRFHE